MTLHCNVASHWLGAYTKWSLKSVIQFLYYQNHVSAVQETQKYLYFAHKANQCLLRGEWRIHTCVSNVGLHWFRKWLLACSAPSHFLKQCWIIVVWTFGNKFKWNCEIWRNSEQSFIQENEFETIVCKMSFFFRLRCVKTQGSCGSYLQTIDMTNLRISIIKIR